MRPKRVGSARALRARAERVLTDRSAAPSEATVDEALHELRVHQVELELQIEELRRAEDELQKLRDRYMSLYEDAPVGYVTLDRYNLITQANSAASKILGMSKTSLATRRFSSFMDDSSRSTFFRVTAEARDSGTKLTFDARLSRASRPRTWVKLDCSAASATGELRITLVDITERRNAEKELRTLAAGLIELQEKERKAVAEALHDDAGQQLTYLTILLDQARQSHVAPDARTLDQLSEVARKILQMIRTLSASLSPAELSRIGLPGAVQGMIAEFTARTRVPVSFAASGVYDTYSFEVSLAAYRIVQEALTNAARHAQPRSVSVTMRSEAGLLNVQVHDDGKGFSVDDSPLSLGLLSMRERARTAGGKIEIASSPGKGTRVTFVLTKERRRGPARVSVD